MNSKRGQFFFVATIIIVGLVIALTSVINIVRVGGKQEQFYDLSEEVGFETKRVLDYGVYNSKNSFELINGFLKDYANYIAKDQVLFIFGNSSNISGIFFDSTQQIGSVGIDTGGGITEVPIQGFSGEFANVSVNAGIVYAEINNVSYDFNLKQGQNFFFVIVKEENGEKFVAQG